MPIDLSLFFIFMIASLAMVISPGPFVSLIIAETMRFGRAIGIAIIIGGFFAGIVFFTLYFFGAALFLDRLDPVYFDMLRYAGSLYLLWLAYGMINHKDKGEITEDDQSFQTLPSTGKAIARGFIICVANPKAIVFFAVFFPQFINKDLPYQPQILLMGVAFLIIGLLSDLFWMAVSLKSRGWIYKKGGQGLINKISGFILLIGAIALLFIQ